MLVFGECFDYEVGRYKSLPLTVAVTGASGYIGTVLCKQLVEHGHQVLGLARSEKSANALVGLGYQVLRGDLHDLDSLKQGAKGGWQFHISKPSKVKAGQLLTQETSCRWCHPSRIR